MNSLLDYRNCAAKFEMCIPHSMVGAHFQLLCVETNSKGRYDEKGSNSFLQFCAWDVPIKDEIGEV